MTVTSSTTPIENVTADLMDYDVPVSIAATSVSDVMASINTTLQSAGNSYADYSCKTVSWDDVTRGTVGGNLSCWGANITDTRLYEKKGKQLYTVRSNNFNEKLGKVSADDLALVTGNQQPGGGPLAPVTLRDVLRNVGTYGAYAGLDKSVSLADTAADNEVSIRFMTTFLPVADASHASLEFAPEVYQYQTRSDSDPANLLLLATTQGVAVQANGAGATKLYHHAVEPSGQINRFWFEAERSSKTVGGPQLETKEEAEAAAQRGKATASVIGTRSMGTRFNVLMTIQVPLRQKLQEPKRFCSSPGSMMFNGAKGGFGGVKGGFVASMQLAPAMAMCPSDNDESDADWGMDVSGCATMPQVMPDAACVMPPGAALPLMRKACRSRSRAAPPRVGTANAARVSRGSMVDKVAQTVKIAKPQRDASQHVTVTVVIYNTVAGGVPSAADVKAAVDDMEALYASCGWTGRLASADASFVKKELTIKDALDINDKLVQQPYVPPPTSNLVMGGNVFPTSSAVA